MTALKPILILAALLLAATGHAQDPDATEAESVPAQSEAPAAVPARFQLGRHYQRLSPTQPTSSSPDQIEVAEIFWYGCPHCFAFEPYLDAWRQDRAEYISFVRIPAAWNALAQMHARAFYTAEVLDKTEEMHGAIFREIHENDNLLDNEDALRRFFGRFGVDAEEFDSAFNSLAVHTRLQRADELNRRYRIASVPEVVVNGKYTTNASMAGGYDALIEVINELAALEAAAR